MEHKIHQENNICARVTYFCIQQQNSLKMSNLNDNPIKSDKIIRNSVHSQYKDTNCQSQQKLQSCYHEYLIFQ